jgi:uncharacterized protein (TIGR00725 family)
MSLPHRRVRRQAIAVVGAGECDDEVAVVAREIGRLIALQGGTVVTGGLTGVMEAASRGAHDAGGLVVGILPGSEADAANDAVDIAIPTGMGQLRNGLVVNSAGAVIAVSGEWGTLSEIGFALKTGKPVIGWRTWQLMKDATSREGIVPVSDPTEAVREAFARYVE